MKIDLNNLKSKINLKSDSAETVDISNKDIAVIGMACKFASAESTEEFWEVLKNGVDCIRAFPRKRQRYGEDFLAHQDRYQGEDGFYEGGFLEHADLFDNEFFGISPMEAALMSPDQRNFLETAWSAIEDSGYGGNKLKGSKTGIFLGHSSDFGVSYKEFIDACNPAMATFAISGNLNTIIASRLSYLLDFKGPSINVDTACSSALTAIHTACRSLREGDCTVAIAGASKIDNLPLKSIKKKEDELGITSADGRTRSFDHASQGTGLGEGVGVIVLKPLAQAQKDGDQIHAVIRGSAVNQDGTSANLTAPNPDAQAELIIKACQDARVHPESISYIEAHGTGTKLGDPIEISGITKAFRQYTDKKQFCAIGSVKSNLGHLDNAAGMAGIIKAILSLKHKAIPPSVHYTSANEKISFEESPVYVNAAYKKWESDNGKRRCSVSAFGLSGTNCHIILEEAEDVSKAAYSEDTDNKIVTLSAKSQQELLMYIWKYQEFLNRTPDINLRNLCFTTNTGRSHYTHRIAIIFKDYEELKKKLEDAYLHCLDGIRNEDIHDAEEEALTELCIRYEQGGEIDWNHFYREGVFGKVSLPTYPFAKITHWIETVVTEKEKEMQKPEKDSHPLLDYCLVNSFDTIVYASYFTVAEDWVLKEHLVASIPVIPGTTYIEMVTEVVKRHFAVASVNITDLVFLSPLSLDNDAVAEVHTVIKNIGDRLSFTVASKTEGEEAWIIHAEGKIDLIPAGEFEPLDLETIKQRCTSGQLQEYAYEEGQSIELSGRWDCVRDIYVNEDEILAFLTMKEEYQSEVDDYTLHPALLDEAINITLRTIGKGLYLPFSYKKLIIYNRLPKELYSYVIKKKMKNSTKEIASFDVILTDSMGTIIAKAYDYTIKKIDMEHFIGKPTVKPVVTYQLSWIPKKLGTDSAKRDNEVTVVLKGAGNTCQLLTDKIKEENGHVIEIEMGDHSEAALDELKKTSGILNQYKSCHIVDLSALEGKPDLKDDKQFRETHFAGVYGLIAVVRLLVESLKNTEIQVTIVGEYAHEVTQEQKLVVPLNAALYCLGKALHDEYRQIVCNCIDIDYNTGVSVIANEMFSKTSDYLVSYRDNIRFVEQLDNMDLQTYGEDNVSIREKGTYLITGGTGGIGLLIAEYLSAFHTNIVLLNRSSFPAQDLWDAILATDSDSGLKEKINKLKELQDKGATVAAYPVDVSNEEMLQNTLQAVRDKFGKIDGIFHAAGVAGDGFLIRRKDADVKRVMAPKMAGTCLLDSLTEQDRIDFLVLFSSVSAILPEAGQCDYAAANSFLDSYAADRNRRGRKTIAINWPSFAETGMAVNFGVDLSKEIFKPIKNNEAVSLLDWAIRHKAGRMIAGELNYTNYIRYEKHKKLHLSENIVLAYVNKAMQKDLNHVKNSRQKGNQKQVELIGGDGNYTKTERQVAAVIGNALGRTSLSISDGFLKLGGNSILAVKVEIDMEEQGLNCTLSDLYAYQSIRDLAAYMDGNEDKAMNGDADVGTDSPKPLSGLLLDGIEPFVAIIFKGCFQSALLSALGHYHRSPLYFIANDIVVYGNLEENNPESLSIKYIPMKTFDESAQQASLAVDKRYQSHDLVFDLKQSIAMGKPVIIAIDCFYEPLSHDCYHKEHSPHSILVYGYEEEQELFHIIEHRTSGSALYEKMQMTYTEIKECYYGYCENFQHVNIIESNEGAIVYAYEEECPTYFELRETGNKNMLAEEQLRGFLLQGLSTCQVLTTEGLLKLRSFKEVFHAMISEEAVFARKHEKIISNCNNIINGQKVKQYQFNYLYPEDGSINEKLKAIIQHWDKIRNIAVKYSYTKVYKEGTRELLISHIDHIIELETQLDKEVY